MKSFLDDLKRGEKVRNYWDDFFKKCTGNHDLFDEKFPAYLGKTLLEIQGISYLTESIDEFKLSLHFCWYASPHCVFYYGQKHWIFFDIEQSKIFSGGIKTDKVTRLIDEIVYPYIASNVYGKNIRRFNIVIEKRFEKAGVPNNNSPIEVLVCIEFMGGTKHTFEITSIPKWNRQEYEYFTL